jgi:predicted Zn-dependent protease
LISALHRGVDKYPEDDELQQSLDKAYKTAGNAQTAVSGWEQLSKHHPKSQTFDQRLAEAYVSCQNPIKMIPGFMELLDKQPDNTDFQKNLLHAHEKLDDPLQALENWNQLVKRHPRSRTLMGPLAQALAVIDDADVAMATWWELLKSNPLQISILRQFWAACDRRRGQQSKFASSILGVVYFIWLCTLNFISDECLKYGVDDVDWWPLAREDDLMGLRPYMVKRQWSCVKSSL